MATPQSPSEITVDWLRTALQWKRGGEPVAAEVEPGFGEAGPLGKIARVKLAYSDQGLGPSSVVVKFQTKVTDKEREAQVYRLLSESQLDSVPRLLGVFDHGTLALEDLSPARPGSKVEGDATEHARAVLSMLAGVHGRFRADARVPLISSDHFASVIKFRMEQSWDQWQAGGWPRTTFPSS